jgi:hypothetical protein
MEGKLYLVIARVVVPRSNHDGTIEMTMRDLTIRTQQGYEALRDSVLESARELNPNISINGENINIINIINLTDL